MTTQQVKQFSYPVVSIYEELTGELMEQIAALLAKNGEITSTAKWKIKKLAQMGQLNKQNLELIAQYTAVAPELTRIALTDAATAAIAELEPSLRSAANAGFLAQAQPLSMSNGFFNTLKSFERQSESSLNLVNTVMGYKAKQAYVQLVNKISDIESRMEYIGILDKNAASVLTGTQARQTALRQCIKEFSEKGLPAFVDKAGREWTPEAYINMDIRTTVNNCAHQAQFDRMNDYDADLIMTS
ncbi:MAG: phage minor capsid protein, partial [Ruthenibacterium sp.]